MQDYTDINQIIDAEFAHDHVMVPRKQAQSNGVIRVTLQCTVCGAVNGKGIKKAGYDVDALKWYDDKIRGIYYERMNNRRLELHQARQEEESALWWSQYDEYLKTPHWATLRQKVLTRDNYLCQACLERPATIAHHISYDLYKRLGHSAAFELIAVCKTCHNYIHGQSS